MDELLQLLSTQEYVSGETLCHALGMTRAAVWKRMEKLRAEGYAIAAAGKRGYRLEPPPDALLPGYLQKELTTAWAGRGAVIYAQEMDSTNTVLKRAALQDDLPRGSLALCELQTMGRGRMQRVWEDPEPGVNLTHSVLLKPKLPAEQAQLCTLAAAVAAATAIERQGFQPRIKWPNDVVLNGRKCVGILCEMVADMDGVQFIVLGIGVNVNQRAFPEELQAKATSLWIERHDDEAPRLDRRRLLCDELSALEQAVDTLEKGGLSALLPAYRARSATLGSRVEVIGTAERFTGVAEDLDATGALLVRDERGECRRVLSADVSVRGLMGYV